MAQPARQAVSKLLTQHEGEILAEWQQRLKQDGALKAGRIKQAELTSQCTNFLRLLRTAFEAGGTDADSKEFDDTRDMLTEVSTSRAAQGFSPRETAVFVFSLKQPLFDVLERHG